VELDGGTMEAASAGIDQGSVLVVRLPLASGMAMSTAFRAVSDRPVFQSDARTKLKRVLVVDDNNDALEMLIAVLKTAGFQAFGASLPSEALILAARFAPDAAILDIGLPEMDGFELARAIRSLDVGASMRLIALTGYGREQDIEEGRAAGFDEFFVKPVDFDLLLNALTRPAPSGPHRESQRRPPSQPAA